MKESSVRRVCGGKNRMSFFDIKNLSKILGNSENIKYNYGIVMMIA